MFVDEARICVRGGDGGAGCVAFHREKFRPRGGPDGGNGGHGGDVLLQATSSLATLSKFKKQIHWKARSGGHGSGDRRHGRRGKDLIIQVPLGTSVRDEDGELLADLVRDGDTVIVASGGRGGRGNAAFVGYSNRLPNFAEQGEYGEERWISLELRLLADAALVGMPNTGKSTLISRVSRAKPKIADYPFTTLEPCLGVVSIDDKEFVLADIPGLIEGASDGKGLGDRFLRHVERCRAILLMLDLFNSEGIEPLEQERILLDDLARHGGDLITKPRITVANKVDAGREIFEKLKAERPDIAGISAVTGEGVDTTMRRLLSIIEKVREAEPVRKSFVLHRPEVRGFTIEHEGDAWIVRGPQVERVVAMIDLTDADTLSYVRTRMRALGVDSALLARGVRAGDVVRIGNVEFEWEEDEVQP